MVWRRFVTDLFLDDGVPQLTIHRLCHGTLAGIQPVHAPRWSIIWISLGEYYA